MKQIPKNVHNPQNIRKGSRVVIKTSTLNEISTVLFIEKGIANLNVPLLGFKRWNVKMLERPTACLIKQNGLKKW